MPVVLNLSINIIKIIITLRAEQKITTKFVAEKANQIDCQVDVFGPFSLLFYFFQNFLTKWFGLVKNRDKTIPHYIFRKIMARLSQLLFININYCQSQYPL